MAEDRPDPDAPEHALTTRAAPYPMSRLAPRFDLVDMAAEIQRADATVSMVAGGKLDVIRKQILALQEQARGILEEADRAARLHRARCNFPKRPGHVYHLYRRGEDDLYFSMLSPDDWGGSPPHPYEGSYRLENDQTFTLIEGGDEPR
ncbi:MAG: DUF2452 domain-containing protein [Minicystis sp.]